MPSVASWLEYLEHISSYNQNFKIGFIGVIIGSLAIALSVIVANNENPLFTPLGRTIANIVIIVVLVILWWAYRQGNYSMNALIGISAQRLLDDCFSGNYPVYNNSQGIQDKWVDIQTRAKEISGYSWNNYRFRKRLINDRDAFLVWFDNRH
jgi:hypothetical protein